MTRETKVGLVVAASFVCLVGVVLVSKLREVPPDLGALAGSAASHLGQEPLPPAKGGPPEPPPLTPVKPNEPVSLQRPPEGVVQTAATDPTPPTPVPLPEPTLAPEPPLKPEPTPASVVEPMSPPEGEPMVTPTPLPTPSPVPSPVVEPTPTPLPLPLPLPLPSPTPAPVVEPTPSLEGNPLLPPAPPPLKEAVPAPVSEPAPPAVAPPIAPPVPMPEPAKVEPVLAPPPGPVVIPSPMPDPMAGVIVSPPRPTTVLPASPPGVAPSPMPPPIPPSADDAPASTVVQNEPKPMPPIGAPVTVQTPAIQIGTPKVQPKSAATIPQVDSFDEESYTCKPGDTLQSISARFFGTEKYAQALLMFNRAHPMSSEGLLRNPPVLNVGSNVYIPPAPVLEKRYGSTIPDLKPIQTPQKVNDGGGGNATSSGTGTGTGWRKYKVAGAGEWMLDIARRTLGNQERWREIYRLNPNFRPETVVPSNAVLNLPPDAKIDMGHTP